MNVLVTGSEGTLGKPLVKELRSRGFDVSTLDMQHGTHRAHFRADVGNYREVSNAFRANYPDVVFHLAAEFGRKNGEEFYERLWQTNVIGTRNVLEMQVKEDFRLVFAGSSESYGNSTEQYLYESDLDAPGSNIPYHENDYALSKWVNERQIMRFQKQFSTQSVNMRFFNAYGPGEHYHPYRSVVCLFVWRLLTGQHIDVYRNYHRVFMYIDDFIPTLANAASEKSAVWNLPPGEAVNIGGTEYRSVEDLAEIALKETGADPRLVRYLKKEEHNTVNKRPNIVKAQDMLEHKPTVPLEEGVKKTVEWMRTLL